MILVDAAAVPDHPSGVRTRLRGLLEAYGRLEEVPAVTVQVSHGSRLLERDRMGGVRVVEVAAAGSPWRRTVTRRESVREDVDLWHSETMPSRGPRSLPNLLTLHDLRHHHARREVGGSVSGHLARACAARLLMPGWLRRLTGVVTVSEASAQEIRQVFRLPSDSVHVVPNAATGLPLQRVTSDPAAVSRWIGRGPFFVAVGHLERRKNLMLLLDALVAGSGGALAETRLVLVGEGRERRALESAVTRRGLGDKVHFTGHLEDPGVAALLDQAVALLFPSLVEGFGFPVFEALGRGCPVIARPLPCLTGLPDGAVARVGDDALQWARGMERLQADTGTAREEVRAATVPLQECTWQRSAGLLADLWRSSLAR